MVATEVKAASLREEEWRPAIWPPCIILLTARRASLSATRALGAQPQSASRLSPDLQRHRTSQPELFASTALPPLAVERTKE